MSFSSLNLDARLLRVIDELGFTEATPVQTQAIPVVLNGNDLMASAQTGTGKTAAFVLPALHKMLNTEAKPGRGPRLLVLSPTRELAEQINEAIQQFSKFCRMKTAVIVGGVSYFHQERALKGQLDVIVATPGRLMDHMGKKRIDFSRMEILVLDEADRMLDMGFIDDIETIAQALPAERQTLLFSATLEGEVLRVAKDILNEPVRIQINGVKSDHAQIDQNIMACDDIRHKQSLLRHILNGESVGQAVVFVATKSGADDLADDLKAADFRAMSLHGDMKQQHRRRVIERMHEGRVKVLVATDVAARGLDVKGITHVINYELPMVPEDYVHRVGRTGRGNASGEAVSLITPEDWRKWFRIEKLLGKKFEEIEIDGLEPKSGRPARGAGGGRSEGRGGRGFGGRGSSDRHSRGGRSFGGGRGSDRSDRGPARDSGGAYEGRRERSSSDDRFANSRTERSFSSNRNDDSAPRFARGRDDSAPRFARSEGDAARAPRPRREFDRNEPRAEFAPRKERGEFAPRTERSFSDDKPRFRTRRPEEGGTVAAFEAPREKRVFRDDERLSTRSSEGREFKPREFKSRDGGNGDRAARAPRAEAGRGRFDSDRSAPRGERRPARYGATPFAANSKD